MTMIATLRFLLVVALTLSVIPLLKAKEEEVGKDFFFACSGGKVDEVKAFLKEHPDWSNACTPEGESCLHLAAIPGSAEVTKLLLESGADPNARTTFDGGLRMHPLSWNVYGGHFENVKLLLENGAEVNADVDSGDGSIITVLDANLKFLDPSGEPTPYTVRSEKIQKLLLKHGAKTFADLQKDL